MAVNNSPAISFQNTQSIGAPYPEVTTNNTITTGTTVPNIQTVLIGGADLAGRMRLPSGPNLDADPLRSASRNTVYVDLGTEQVQPGQLLVQPANANITPKDAFTASGGLRPSPLGVTVGDFNQDDITDIAGA